VQLKLQRGVRAIRSPVTLRPYASTRVMIGKQLTAQLILVLSLVLYLA
jgi:hypothetical protein